jgi:hypothetical protein
MWLWSKLKGQLQRLTLDIALSGMKLPEQIRISISPAIASQQSYFQS